MIYWDQTRFNLINAINFNVEVHSNATQSIFEYEQRY